VAGIIDTRPYADYYKEHIVGSINIDYSTGDFIALTTPLPKDGKYIIFGSSDDEATSAAQAMFNRGYVAVTNVGTYDNAKTVIDLPLVKNSNK